MVGLANPERRTTYWVPPGVSRLWPRNSYRSPVRLRRKRWPGCRLRKRVVIPSPVLGETKHDAPSNDNFKSKGLRNGRRQDRQWEHRKVAGAKPGEIVHHIDGNPLNNEKENLHIFKTAQDHAIAHRSLEKAAYALLSHGIVVFDQDSGVYILSESFLRSI